jgi:hypothetical protein
MKKAKVTKKEVPPQNSSFFTASMIFNPGHGLWTSSRSSGMFHFSIQVANRTNTKAVLLLKNITVLK